MTEKFQNKFGWIPDYPDFRDYTAEHDKIKPILRNTNIIKAGPQPSATDLRKWCSPVEDQQNIGSCTAHAVAGVVEYFENKAFGKYIDASRLFLYKTTRNLLHANGDTGAFLRSTIGALVLFGMPPEDYWPYNTAVFDEEPNAFCYAFGQSYRCITYFKHDPPNVAAKSIISGIRKYLASGIPAVFGFTVYQSVQQAAATGKIPFPVKNEKLLGGHAVAAVGYDDGMAITNETSGVKTKGAFLIRNSWGTNWGESGYGWLPYEYALQGLAIDWWSVIKQDWIDTGFFVAAGDVV